ncbi:FAD binding domain-containing protein [Alicyclobacillus fastidiosus]|uniref:FAD binding domain-containing protein n=1 Tax=Alicyclobacillus fastidiosus TaxID=392011 RepID=A0ABY6ZIR2_9BACL|nr:FAD binding domain-containing protein [Alicyclobacillus fastidiosus]WAH42721.1 FAD binding domain-containing protein [Alicyclobacillus fastidiosus]
MKPAVFSYHKSTSVEEAVKWLDQHPEGKILAGGQSLIPLMNFRLSRPEELLDITGIPQLDTVSQTGDRLVLGGLIRHQDLAEHDQVRGAAPVLAEAASHVGHWAIRNRGTLGGSLVHADPAAELPAAMVALDATFELVSRAGVREVPARDFYLGFLTTDIMQGELLTRVSIPIADKTAFGFAEVARRPGDFALAGSFVEVGRDASGAITWFGISGGPERRAITWPTDAQERAHAILEQLDTVDILDDEAYRHHVAQVVAEETYRKAAGGSAR